MPILPGPAETLTETRVPLPCPEKSELASIDLSEPPVFQTFAERAAKLPAGAARSLVQELSAENNPSLRIHALCEIYRKLETAEIADHLKTASRMAVRDDVAGLRLLFGFLEVKRPGVEVMRQIEPLASLERVALKIVSGYWTDQSDEAEGCGQLITDTLRGAFRVGALGRLEPEALESPDLLRDLIGQLRAWYRNTGRLLDAGRKLPAPMLNVVIQVANLEIILLERRLSRIANKIDPYDARGIARVMPVVSYYDQDIEHLKSVVSRLETYHPFHERLLTMEQTLTTREVDKVGQALRNHVDGFPMDRILSAMRTRPLLDREFAYLVGAVHQVATLRAQHLAQAPPDVLSVMLQVVQAATSEGIEVTMEPAVLEAIAPELERLGLAVPTGASATIRFREERAAEFILPDGLPRLSPRAEDKDNPLSIKDLIYRSLGNEAFMLGLLDNTRVTGYPGVVSLIALQSRSLKVLRKIAVTRNLHTGPARKDVPRLLLLNPTRVPINTLKPLIHVRFISRVDLERLSRSGNEIRSEIRKEIGDYLRFLKK